MSQPDKQNVHQLIEALKPHLDGQPTVDVYNVLTNLLGWVIAQSSTPTMQLMKTFEALATAAKIPFEKVTDDDTSDTEDEEEVQSARPDQPTH